MDNAQVRAVLRTAIEIWDKTGGPVSAEAITQAVGFGDETVQLALRSLDANGYFGDALRGDDRIVCIAVPTAAARQAAGD
ncbi:hypothetical protein AWC11_11305 [Mycobacterium interjectum]|nr:hypothetical protein AWC11_11305 [Mycobacterium interjectum]